MKDLQVPNLRAGRLQQKLEEIKEVASHIAAIPSINLSQEEYDVLHASLGAVIARWRVHAQAERQFLPCAILAAVEQDFVDLAAKHRKQCFVVAVVALCKSGKSTFMNALMGCDYLPSHNLPETARIVRVKHTVTEEGYLTDGEGNVVHGHAAIRERLKVLNHEARASGMWQPDAGNTSVTDPGLFELVLHAPFVSLEGKPFDQQSFAMLDTPGPNEAKCMPLVKQVQQIMNKADVILYLLDYTKLKTKEEEEMFANLRHLRADLCDSLPDRLFLIVNKIDLRNRHGLSPKQTVTYVADMLSNNIPELKLQPDRVLLVSSEYALLSRQVRNGTASEATKADFCEKMYGLLSDEDNSEERMYTDAPLLLSRSGFTEMESHVLSFMYDNKRGILIDSILGDALRHLCQFYNYLITCRGALLTEKNEAEICTLKEALNVVLRRFERVKEDIQVKKSAIQEWVEASFHQFHRECDSFLERTFTSADYTYVSRNQEDITYVLTQKSSELAKELDIMFHRFRTGLENEAFEQQDRIYKELSKEIQPFCEEAEKHVGEFLDISESLYPVPVQFPCGDRDHFSSDLNEQIEMMITRAKGTLVYEDPSRKKKEAGWCHWLSSKNKVSIPVDLYTTNREALTNYWRRLVVQNTQESCTTAKAVVSTKVSAAFDVAQSYLQTYLDGYCNTIQFTICNFSDNETKRINRLHHVNSLIADLRCDMRTLLGMRSRHADSAWLHRMLDALDTTEEEEMGLDEELLLFAGPDEVDLTHAHLNSFGLHPPPSSLVH
eukprot:GGOE01053252.1.p1 GENE.GGOE01053252.1~~GGOE01053252.1.p1  ORF type:complete len:779 (-),score=298.54 GGOE01053252.1:1913-4249(-)